MDRRLSPFKGTLLPVMPLHPEIEAGKLVAVAVASPVLQRGVALCASKHIPLSAAALAISALTRELTRELCRTGAWIDAEPAKLAESIPV